MEKKGLIIRGKIVIISVIPAKAGMTQEKGCRNQASNYPIGLVSGKKERRQMGTICLRRLRQMVPIETIETIANPFRLCEQVGIKNFRKNEHCDLFPKASK